MLINHKRAAVGAAIGLAAVIAFGVGACGTHSNAPEPSPGNIIDGTRTQVIRMPNGFRNIAFTCYGTVGIYDTSRGIIGNNNGDAVGSSVAVLPDDPHCK